MMKNIKNILFTAGGSPVHEVIFQQLNKKYNLYFADFNIEKISLAIPNENKIKLPLASSKNFKIKLLEICRKFKINILVPGVDEELIEILLNKKLFLPTKIFLPKMQFVQNMLDKLKMNELFVKKNIYVPKSLRADKEMKDIRFPVIVKTRYGRGSRNVFTVINEKKLGFFLKSIDGDLKDWMIQEKEEGQEYTVQIFSNSTSSLQCILPIKVNEKRGSTIDAQTVNDNLIYNYCLNIHKEFEPNSCYNVQLIKRNDGIISCFEVNPRISTTFCMGIYAGFDPFENYFKREINTYDQQTLVPSLRLIRHWKTSISKEFL